MCTLSLMPLSDGTLIITSNRDEAPNRETFPPEIYDENGVRLLFPKDGLAGGTWIGLSDRKRFVSLMNGGFTAHQRKETYRMSRGIIVKDFLFSENLLRSVEECDLHDIEPFTVVAVDWADSCNIYELIWDGKDKYLSEKPLSPAIWSSSLLYSEEMKSKREQWFSTFLFDTVSPNAAEILRFHREAGEGSPVFDLVMDRHFVKTRSITQVIINERPEMFYEDLQTQEKTIKRL